MRSHEGRQDWPFLAVCGLAGALAVPLSAVATPVALLVAVLVGFLGLRLWRWAGLDGLVKSPAAGRFERVSRPIVFLGLGLLVGLLVLAVLRLVVEPNLPAVGARIAAAAELPIWRRVLRIYVAAVGEEVLFRLLLLSAVAGLTARLFRPSAGVASRGVLWLAIGLSTLAFAAIHLPAWSAAGPLSLGLALMVVTLNSLAGVVFGYVFVKRGLGLAIWTHAGADCAVQLIGPLT